MGKKGFHILYFYLVCALRSLPPSLTSFHRFNRKSLGLLKTFLIYIYKQDSHKV
jgi:hypothetical protein